MTEIQFDNFYIEDFALHSPKKMKNVVPENWYFFDATLSDNIKVDDYLKTLSGAFLCEMFKVEGGMQMLIWFEKQVDYIHFKLGKGIEGLLEMKKGP